jgi:hypothetical protein
MKDNNKLKRKKIFNISLLIIFFSFLLLFFVNKHSSLASDNPLAGRILLQVEENGEAWYLNPLNEVRYYLGRPADAFNLMRSLGLGVSNNDIDSFISTKAPSRLSGRILIKAEDKGQAFYVNPENLELVYLRRPADAFNVMRTLGLGITNSDLAKINSIEEVEGDEIGDNGSVVKRNYSFKYSNNDYTLDLNLNSDLYNYYSNKKKSISYYKNNPPADLREEFYAIFFKSAGSDDSISDIILKARELSAGLNLTDDEFAEFIISLVQYIPYDFAKVSSSLVNTNPYYPYETLYLNKGVCSDKTFLGIMILRELGYGSAILDFPEANHSALGISCKQEYSVNNSGYCFIETTNYFPFAVVPNSMDDGKAQTDSSNFSDISSATHLGEMNVFQAREGNMYLGAKEIFTEAEELITLDNYLSGIDIEIESLYQGVSALESQVSELKDELNNLEDQEKIEEYNNLLPEYNEKVKEYNEKIISYENLVSEYNKKINEYNRRTRDFFQK